MILDIIKRNVIEYLQKNELALKIVDAVVGYFYTIVVTEDENGEKYIGLNITPSFEISEIAERRNNPKFYPSIQEEIELLTSESWIERSLALATVNSLSQKLLHFQKVNNTNEWIIRKLYDISASKVAIIGNMPPVVRELKKYFVVYTFDKKLCGNVLSESLEKRILPQIDAVIMSGATIINESIDEILEYARNSKLNIIIGPSAQIHPMFIKGVKIHYLGSTAIINNKEEAIQLLKLGYTRGVFYDPRYSMQYFVSNEDSITTSIEQ